MTTELASLTASLRSIPWLRLAKLVAVPIVTVLASAFFSYGTVQFSRGRDAQRLDQLEQDSARTVTLREFKLFTDSQDKAFQRIDDQLREIKQDVREIKK